MEDKPKLSKLEVELSKTYFTESVKKIKKEEATDVHSIETHLTNLVLDIFKNITIEVDPTVCINPKATKFWTASVDQPNRKLEGLRSVINLQACSESVAKHASWIKDSPTGKLFLEESTLNIVYFMVEIVKKAWYFGQVPNNEFIKLLSIIKTPAFMSLMPIILGCYRLINELEIPESSFLAISEIITSVLNQAANQYDLAIPSRLLTTGETYYCVRSGGKKEYLMRVIRENKIFSYKDFWNNYLIYSIIMNSKDQSFLDRRSIDLSMLRKSAQDSVTNTFLTVIFEMANAGVDKNTVKEVILIQLEKFRLSEKNAQQVIAFLNDCKKS